MYMRTLLRKLRKLCEEGWLDHEEGRYSINDKLKADVRLFAPQFGSSALSNIMQRHYPLFKTLERNLDDLITIFGVYLIYCFAEVCTTSS